MARVSLHFAYESDDSDCRNPQRIQELGLFTEDEMGGAFEAAGLRAMFDPVGLSGRRPWTAAQEGGMTRRGGPDPGNRLSPITHFDLDPQADLNGRSSVA